jgi:hypothetical protein
MFLNIIKNFLLKNKVSKLLSNVTAIRSEGVIKTVGVIFDGILGLDIINVVNELVKHGIEEKDIKVLIFKNKIPKNEVNKYDVFSYKEINWSGEILDSNAKLFLNTNFDLLINYHDFENTPLVYASYLSVANFKVGFTTKDKIINQFMINTGTNNYQLFIDELVKYLKILNKI